MLADYHTHTRRCGHASGELREFIEAAIARGLDEIGLSDHLWLYFVDAAYRDPTYAMREDEFATHFEEMVSLRAEYEGRIRVRVGVEADYVEGSEEVLRSILGTYDLDYVLGSVHFVDGWCIDAPENAGRYEEMGVDVIYRRYYETMQKAIRLGVFDVLAHFDLPKKFGFRPATDMGELVAETLDLAAVAGVAIELSSAGLRKPAAEIYPSSTILRGMRERDIPIVLSSDAHRPDEVGADFDLLMGSARSAGYAKVASYQRRERAMKELG